MKKREILKKMGLAGSFIVISNITGCELKSQNKELPSISESMNSIQKSNANTSEVIDAKFEANRQLWLEKKIPDYSFTVSAYTGGNVMYADPVTIEVKGGKVVSTSSVSKSDKKSLEIYKDIDTIDKIFNKIQEGYENGARVAVKYDADKGYPVRAEIHAKESISDGWLVIIVKKLSVAKN